MSSFNSFTFVVLTYNHARFILEHLESIKYLIKNYGSDIDVDIIIADDASQDGTVKICKLWFEKNSHLFRKVSVLSGSLNRGTCKNLTNALAELNTYYCKITAGDDVYSYENLFLEINQLEGNHLLSGLPLNLINQTLESTRFEVFNLYATNIIYKNTHYLKRLKRINFFNSPSIVYAVPELLRKDVTAFVAKYYVTEDYPLQIKMAELLDPLRFVQVDKIFVYYRRTESSTYIIKNNAFNQDKINIFNYLIKSEKVLLDELLLQNRLFCFKLKNKYLKRILNLNIYLYGFGVLTNIFTILYKLKGIDIQFNRHQSHYDLILLKANLFYSTNI